MTDKIVAIGFLTSRDLAALGNSFTRHFPLPSDDGKFVDLLKKLDEVEPVTPKPPNGGHMVG